MSHTHIFWIIHPYMISSLEARQKTPHYFILFLSDFCALLFGVPAHHRFAVCQLLFARDGQSVAWRAGSLLPFECEETGRRAEGRQSWKMEEVYCRQSERHVLRDCHASDRCFFIYVSLGTVSLTARIYCFHSHEFGILLMIISNLVSSTSLERPKCSFRQFQDLNMTILYIFIFILFRTRHL